SNLRIRNNTIYNLNDPSNNNIRAIVISGARTSDPDQNIIVESNLIYNVRAEDAAIALVDGWGTPKGVEIRNNVIANLQRGQGIIVYRGTNHKLYNNTIYKATGEGIEVITGSVSVINNLLVGNNSGGDQISFSGTVTSTNNGYSNTFGGSCTNCVSGLSAATFANAAGNNLHLVPGSLAIGRGTTLTTFSTDKDGVARPQGAAWDIGAYESTP
ncbi:MAG TPA: choice-of-anchor Q domain-containing protein, partial [Terriglobia bacterium]|nr:choice-of-anchor Q domain-containing protein [Terriglobia bacterium]